MRSVTSLRGFKSNCPPAVVLGDLTLIRPHGMAGIPVVVVTTNPEDISLHSRYVQGSWVVPGFGSEHSDAAADALVSLGEQLHGQVGCKLPLVYCTDVQLELVYKHRARLSEHYHFTLNEKAVADALGDKELFAELVRDTGLRVPRSWSATHNTEDELRELREPLIAKPKQKTDHWEAIRRDLFDGEGKARIFATRDDLLSNPAFQQHKDELLVQECIPPGDDGLVSFHGFADESGRLLASFCGRKVRTWPRVAGDSAFIEVTDDPAVRAEGIEVATKLGLKGPFKIDFLRDSRNGDLYLLEVNPRFNLWHYVGACSGVNLPAVAYEYQVHGRDTAAVDVIRPGYRWVNVYRDYKAYKELHAMHAMGFTDWLAAVASPGNVYETFSWDDPAPFLYWVKGFGPHLFGGHQSAATAG